ncbi:IS801, transposase, partial [Pseudomonas syringae pv. actinidiae ICMP 19068]
LLIIMKPAYPPLLLQMSPAYTPRPLKNLFTANQCWAHLLEEGGLRDIEVESVTKMLACGTSIGVRGAMEQPTDLRSRRTLLSSR